MNARDYLSTILPSENEIETFLAQQPDPDTGFHPNQGFRFDGALGWLRCPTFRRDAMDGSLSFYSYDPDGARHCINSADQPCRIHTYGDSFTHCDQVSDGETWQEYLAAHLREPVRNYGIGGYSVYQAYRRMLVVEKEHPAEHIMLNIYDDDHYRNLDSWRAIRFGHRGPCGFPLPHVRVNPAADTFAERDNVIQSANDIRKLMDLDFVAEQFQDCPVLNAIIASKNELIENNLPEPVSVTFGIPLGQVSDTELGLKLRKEHGEAALYASKRIVMMFEEHCKQHGKKFMLALSFGRANMRKALAGEPRFDQKFLDWANTRNFPVVDMLEAFKTDFARSNDSAEDYIKQYYIGHHNPAGTRPLQLISPQPKPSAPG